MSVQQSATNHLSPYMKTDKRKKSDTHLGPHPPSKTHGPGPILQF